MAEQRPGDPDARILEFDGLRGIGVAGVVLWHYLAHHIGGLPPESPWFYVARVLSLSAAMMDMFFVLSGYLIGGIVIDHRRSPNLFRVFYLRRAVRVLPAYAVLLVASLVLRLSSPAFREPDVPFFEGTIPWWSYLTFTQNFFQMARNAPGALELSITWSLALEEQFYALMPVLIYWVSPRRLPAVLCAGLTVSPLLRWWFPEAPVLANTILGRSDPFFLGVLLAVGVRTPAVMRRAAAHRATVSVVAVLLLLVTAGTASRSFRAAFGGFIYSWWALTWAALFLLVLVQPAARLTWPLRWRVAVWLGGISYGVYLYHWTVRNALMVWLRGSKWEVFDVPTLVIVGAAIGLSIALAAASYYGMERRLLRWGHGFRYARIPTADPPRRT